MKNAKSVIKHTPDKNVVTVYSVSEKTIGLQYEAVRSSSNLLSTEIYMKGNFSKGALEAIRDAINEFLGEQP